VRRRRRKLFLTGALLEIDAGHVERAARERQLSPEDALSRLLEEAVADAERAGRTAAKASGQKLARTHAEIAREHPARLTAGAALLGDRGRAEIAFERWNETLEERATILRTYLQGEEGILREWIDEGFRKEIEEGWTEEKAEQTRQLIESIQAASAERERQLRRWWWDWGQAWQYPWWTRTRLAGSCAGFGFIYGIAFVRLEAWWSTLLAVVVGALVGVALAQHGVRLSRNSAATPPDG
jgi:hypothetical protein